MGITTKIEDEFGKGIATVEDPTNILHRVLPDINDRSFRCLNYVDWYADTTFNKLQRNEVVLELKRLCDDRNRSADEVDLLQRIIALAEGIESEPHIYLKFYGD
jgi:hypothetical protein